MSPSLSQESEYAKMPACILEMTNVGSPSSGMIKADMDKGARYIDLGAELLPEGGAPVSEVALAQLEQVIQNGSMPPHRYRLLH